MDVVYRVLIWYLDLTIISLMNLKLSLSFGANGATYPCSL